MHIWVLKKISLVFPGPHREMWKSEPSLWTNAGCPESRGYKAWKLGMWTANPRCSGNEAPGPSGSVVTELELRLPPKAGTLKKPSPLPKRGWGKKFSILHKGTVKKGDYLSLDLSEREEKKKPPWKLIIQVHLMQVPHHWVTQASDNPDPNKSSHKTSLWGPRGTGHTHTHSQP